MNLYEKLSRIQVEMKCNKGQYNAFGKYHYRSCEDIQEAVKPYLRELKCLLTVSDEIVLIGDRYYVKATATLIDAESEAKITNTAYAREELEKKGMDASQITGATSSYARKYALNRLLCLDDVKDADTGKSDEKEESKNNSKTTKANDAKKNNEPNPEIQVSKHDALVGTFHQEIARTGKSLKWFLDSYKVTDARNMSDADLEKCIKMLRGFPDKG